MRYAVRWMGWSAVALVPAAGALAGWRAAAGLAGGMLWALANVWTLRRTLGPLATGARRHWWQHAGWWCLKVPVLYALGGLLLLSPWGSPIGFLAGFSWWFVVLCVGALRQTAS